MTSVADSSPLVQIELEVQRRAARSDLDVADADGARRLRRLVEEVIDEWGDSHRRGHRPHPLSDPDALADRAMRNLAGYGPLSGLLSDDDVWEIMVNAPDEIFVKRHSGGSHFHHEVFHDDEHVGRTVTKLLEDSAASHRKLDPTEGLQDAQLDDGARVHIVHGDLSRGGHLMVNIRKFTGMAITSLDRLVQVGTLSQGAATFLRAAIRARMSIVFAGAPGAGKTTLLSCCAAELDPSLRVVIAEEVFEADVPLANVAGMQTRPARADRAEVDLRRLVAGFLRMAPDVAIVGEVRDREALPLLLTLSSGVTGFTTIHAGSARQALTRLRFLAQLSDAATQLPVCRVSCAHPSVLSLAHDWASSAAWTRRCSEKEKPRDGAAAGRFGRGPSPCFRDSRGWVGTPAPRWVRGSSALLGSHSCREHSRRRRRGSPCAVPWRSSSGVPVGRGSGPTPSPG